MVGTAVERRGERRARVERCAATGRQARLCKAAQLKCTLVVSTLQRRALRCLARPSPGSMSCQHVARKPSQNDGTMYCGSIPSDHSAADRQRGNGKVPHQPPPQADRIVAAAKLRMHSAAPPEAAAVGGVKGKLPQAAGGSSQRQAVPGGRQQRGVAGEDVAGEIGQ
ncbi:hypothetical protein ABPG75_010333 [Micractinium tetrahymenae]